MQYDKNENLIARIIRNPDEKYAVKNRLWQGCPTILCTPKGRLFAGWYSGGSGEPSLSNYNLLIRSDDHGQTWSDPLLVIESLKQERVIAIDIQLWLDPMNRMHLFWTQRDANVPIQSPDHLRLWSIICDDPDADELKWSDPQMIAPGFLRCQPTVLSDGRWVLCAYDWFGTRYHYSESAEQGKTWVRREGAVKTNPTNFDESMILERKDGSLLMFARNTSAGFISQSVSPDKGKTWEEVSLSSIPNPSTRFYLRRLKSGRVLLISNIDSKRRINMTAMLSEDDGKTWKYSLTIDPRETSYPDAVEGSDGYIYAVHDRGRGSFREIIISRFTEEDIIAGEIRDHGSWTGHIVSKALHIPLDPEAAELQKQEDRKFKFQEN